MHLRNRSRCFETEMERKGKRRVLIEHHLAADLVSITGMVWILIFLNAFEE